MHERLRPCTVAGFVVLAVAGCAVGPDYQAPVVKIDRVFVNAGSESVNPAAPAPDIARFWEGFGDATLSGLMSHALAANGDVRMAQARLQASRAILLGADAELMPEIDIASDGARALSPRYLMPGTSRGQRTTNNFDIGFVASWELDFFGRNHRARESAAAQLDASQAGVHAVQTSIAAEVASNYLELRGLQQRYDVAERSLDNQDRTLGVTRARLAAGRNTKLDMARARSLFASTQATLPVLRTGIERLAFRLSTLTGQPPRSVLASLETPRPLPALPVTDLSLWPLGTPEQLLRRRPDLVVAERQLAAANADIGVATADLFPRISLTGLIGFASDRVSQLGQVDAQQYSLGAGLSWPLLDFGRVRARIGARRAQAAQALANYEQTVATALEETEGSLSQFTRAASQADFLGEAARNADEATTLSRLRYGAGSADLLIVLDAERQALVSRDALVQAQTRQATSLVSIYRALGGGWSSEALQAAR